MWRDAWVVAVKDLRVELRSRVATNQVLPVALLFLVLFAFALDPNSGLLGQAAPGLYWVAVLFASVLAIQRSMAIESAAGGDVLRLLGLEPAGVFLGKALALALQLAALEAVLAGGIAVLYGASLRGVPLLVASSLLATIGLAASGTIYGTLSSRLRVRETLLPLLLLPIVAPVLLAATKSWIAAGGGHPGTGLPWLELLAAFSCVYVLLGVGSFGALMEVT